MNGRSVLQMKAPHVVPKIQIASPSEVDRVHRKVALLAKG